MYPLDNGFRTNTTLIVYSLVVNLALLIPFGQCLYVLVEKVTDNSIKWFMMQGSTIFTIFVVYFIWILKSRKKIETIFKLLYQVDYLIKASYRDYLNRFLITLSTELVLWFLLAAIELKWMYSEFVIREITTCYVTWVYLNLYVKCLMMPINAIKSRMDLISRLVKRTSVGKMRIDAVSDCYYLLVDGSRLLNDINGFPVVIYVLNVFMQLVITSHFSYTFLYFYNQSLYLLCASVYGCIVASYLIYVFFVLEKTSSLSDKVFIVSQTDLII